MIFTKSCQYAIKAMLFLAQHSKKNECLGIRKIVEYTGAPQYFMSKIMQDLVKNKLVVSTKGPNGGFILNKQKKINLASLVKVIDGNDIFVDCVLGLKECNDKKPCPVHYQFQQIKKDIKILLEKSNILEFNEKLNSNEFFIKT